MASIVPVVDDHLFDLPAAVAHTGRAESTIRARVHVGDLRALKDGRRWLFDPADLDRVFAPRPVVPRPTALVADLERAAQRVAAQAPPLSEATRERVREILGGVL